MSQTPPSALDDIFDLSIRERTSAGYPIEVTASAAGDGRAVSSLLVDEQMHDAVRALAAADTDERFLLAFGEFLFSQLFVGNIASLYRTSLGAVRSQDKSLHLLLRIDPPELATLPWEFLFDRQEGRFLATSAETTLARYLRLGVPARPTLIRPPLRVLAILASPHDLQLLNVDAERAIIEDALRSWVAQGQVEVHYVEHATIANINQAMRSVRPHIFHFVGHSTFNDDRALVALVDEQHDAHFVDERTFQGFFAGAGQTRLAILNACQTATTSSTEPLVGLAPHLLQNRVGAVVAMQLPISDRASQVFAREFYRSIALGYPIDLAVTEARRGIYMEVGRDTPDWGAPVLFQRSRDARLFQIDKETLVQPEMFPPPEPPKPPYIENFVGRAEELNRYIERLRTSGVAVIAGLAGVGKTTLAATIAHSFGEPTKTFWHTFREGEGVEVIIWGLAGFLVWHKHSDLWNMLQVGTRTGGQPPPSEILFDYLLQLIRKQGYLLCLDDFHHVDEDPLLAKLVERLAPLVAAGEVQLLLTSRRIPDFVRIAEHTPLSGLSFADARDLVAARKLSLSDGMFEVLYQRTNGNAELLTLAIQALHQNNDPAHILEHLVHVDDIERYLLNEVDKGLHNTARQVMSGVSALLGYPGTRPVIEEMLGGINARRQLVYLTNRYLLHEYISKRDVEYIQHPIVQAFYYDFLSIYERQVMHQRAAVYYEMEEQDLLKAMLHYSRAADYTRAAQLMTDHLNMFLGQGYAQLLKQILSETRVSALSAELGVKVNLARGRIHAWLGEGDDAHQNYERALTLLQIAADTPAIHQLRAQVCLNMADLLQRETPEAAIELLQRDQIEVKGTGSLEEAAIHIKLGTAQIAMGNFRAALDAVLVGQKLLPSLTTQYHIRALINLSTIYLFLDDLPQAQGHAEEGVKLARQMHDELLLLDLQVNLSVCKEVAGNWHDATTDYLSALAQAESLGNIASQTQIHNNLGILYTNLGEDSTAQEHLEQALRLARKHKMDNYLPDILASNADLHLRRGDWRSAEPLLAEAEKLAHISGTNSPLPEILNGYAQVYLLQGRTEEARVKAEESISLAHQLELRMEKGKSLRTLGQVLLALGQPQAAVESLKKSANLLKDVYELARTNLHLGQALLSTDRITALELIGQANLIFCRLGAKRDQVETNNTTSDETIR